MVHFDAGELTERLGGDQEILQEALAIFLESVEPRVRELKDALSAGNRELLRKLGHTVRGVALTVSAPELVRLGSMLEASSREGSDDELAALVEQLVAEHAVVSAQVRTHLR
jgi:HPt (histidine-containing phosphotransfer) domain-containing protein